MADSMYLIWFHPGFCSAAQTESGKIMKCIIFALCGTTSILTSLPPMCSLPYLDLAAQLAASISSCVCLRFGLWAAERRHAATYTPEKQHQPPQQPPPAAPPPHQLTPAVGYEPQQSWREILFKCSGWNCSFYWNKLRLKVSFLICRARWRPHLARLSQP